MREIKAEEITALIREMCITANKILPNDLCSEIEKSLESETEALPKSIMKTISDNLVCAKELDVPICQDTGMAVIFAEVGQDVHIAGGGFEDAVNEGVRQGYTDGLLRKSVVGDPLKRVNTNDNTPAVIHTRITDGDKIKFTVAPKGFGSENMSKIKMFTPSATVEDIVNFVVDVVKTAGGNPCPPMVLGIGIGGDFEQCAYLSKKALCRSVSVRNSDPFYAELEKKMLKAVDETSVGPQGFGGKTTALAVNIEKSATHIAGLPVSVNVGCHVTRHIVKIL